MLTNIYVNIIYINVITGCELNNHVNTILPKKNEVPTTKSLKLESSTRLLWYALHISYIIALLDLYFMQF